MGFLLSKEGSLSRVTCSTQLTLFGVPCGTLCLHLSQEMAAPNGCHKAQLIEVTPQMATSNGSGRLELNERIRNANKESGATRGFNQGELLSLG